MMFPADHEAWDEAVCASYPINRHVIENDVIRIKLFSYGKSPLFFANAPYLEEGGIFYKDRDKDNNLKGELLKLFEEYNLEYILLKSIDDIFFYYLNRYFYEKNF